MENNRGLEYLKKSRSNNAKATGLCLSLIFYCCCLGGFIMAGSVQTKSVSSKPNIKFYRLYKAFADSEVTTSAELHAWIKGANKHVIDDLRDAVNYNRKERER